jgi:phosphoglycerate dehydrogenase-like enzyme
MADERLVAVSYPVDEEFTRINTGALAGEARVDFTYPLGDDERRETIERADALIGWNLGREMPAGTLDGAAGLGFVQLLSAGADGIDFAAIPRRLVLASNVGAYAGPIAEHVLAMTLSLAKRLPLRHAELAAGRFDQSFSLTLNGAVCAILGYGGIGAATARLMRAFGARIHAVSRSGRADGQADWVSTLDDLDGVLAAADVVVVCLPLTLATRDLIGARELALMKPTAILINVARGAIVQEAPLYEHLRSHPDFSAGIDAWWQEPADGGPFHAGHPFFTLPNFIGSPHNSGIVPGTLAGAARLAAENVLRYLHGEALTGLVRREDYPAT